MERETSSPSTGIVDGAGAVEEYWSLKLPARESGPLVPLLRGSEALLEWLRAASERAERAGEDEPDDLPRLPLLPSIAQLLRAERGFVLEVPTSGAAADHRAVRCTDSSTLDGEPVNQPESKVPTELALRIAKEGRPEAGVTDGHAAWPHERGTHYAAFPLPLDTQTSLVLYVENRFRPLEVSRETIQLALIQLRWIAFAASWDRLRRESLSLWRDVRTLRSRPDPEPSPAAAFSAYPREPSRRARRAQLKGDYSVIIGSSPCMIEIFQIVDRISSSNATVLINGESGTGKELIAKAVHENSPRKGKVFVSENCGALTETLLESELFGYVKGAFTGAAKDTKGLFEQAEGGTLFLDEVGDMSSGMQKKLLRVLQEGVIRRVGGKEYIPVDVRVISATNKDLLQEVERGNFREDLYYRLNVINLRLPPLRERKEDIPDLVEHFLEELGEEGGVRKAVDPATMQRLVQYSWPGNVRELRNEVKRLFALSDDAIALHDLSENILTGEERDVTFHSLGQELYHLTLKQATERLEKELIRHAIVQSRGNKSQVAKQLQVPKTSLYNKINKYGLDKL